MWDALTIILYPRPSQSRSPLQRQKHILDQLETLTRAVGRPDVCNSHSPSVPDPRVQPGDSVLDPIPGQRAHPEYVQTCHPFRLGPVNIG
jgi:hypothetical protein